MQIDEGVIMMYLDGELDPDVAMEVRTAIAASPELQRVEREVRELLGDVTLAFSALPAGSVLPAAGPVSRPSATAPVSDRDEASVVSIDRARATRPPRPSLWASRWLQAAAAVVLVVGGAAGSWWWSRSVGAPTQQVADGLTPLVDSLARASATTAPQRGRGSALATGRRQPTDTSTAADVASPTVAGVRPEPVIPPLREPVATPPSTAGGLRVAEIRVPGTRVESAIDQGGGTSGERVLMYQGTRLTLTYATTVSSDDVVLSSSELATLATSARVDSTTVRPDVARAFRSLSGRASGSTGTSGATACESPLRIRDRSGVIITLTGKRSCAELARLAQGIQVIAGN